MNKILAISCLCLISSVVWAQDSRLKFVGIETGGGFLDGDMPDHNYIRASDSYGGDADQSVTGTTYKTYVGLKGEIRSRSEKFGLTTGLRFSQITSSLGNDYWESTDFFYFTVQQTNNSIEYLRVREIKESSKYIGVPIAVTWYPFNEHLFTFYFKGGLEFNYRVSTETTVDFVDNAMNTYQEDVLNRLDTPQNFVSSLDTSVGVKIGRNSKVSCLIEVGPSVFLNNRTSGITGVQAGGGAQINLLIGL